MAYTYSPSNISAKQRMNMSTWALQLAHIIEGLTCIFASTFMVSFIISINADAPLSVSVNQIAQYYIAFYLFLGLGSFLMSYLVDRSNRVWYYRLGVFLVGGFIVLIIFLGKDIAKMAFLAGSLYGIALGIYYASYNVMKIEMVPRAHADKFIVVYQVLNKSCNMIFPILLGLLIDNSTFVTVSFYVLAFVAIQLILTIFIKSKRPENSSFEPIKYIKTLVKDKSYDIKRIKNFYPVIFSYGLTTIGSTIVSLLTVYTFKTNLNLGLFTALFSFTSFMALLLFKRFTKEGHRKVLYIIFSIISILASVIVAIIIEKWSYLIFNGCISLVHCITAYTSDYQRTVILKKTGQYDNIAEHQVLTEIVINLARVITFVILLVLSLTLDMLGLKIAIIALSICYPLLFIFTERMEKVEKDYPVFTQGCIKDTVNICDDNNDEAVIAKELEQK